MTKKAVLIMCLPLFINVISAQQNIADYSLLDHVSLKEIRFSASNETNGFLFDKDIYTYYLAENFSTESYIEFEFSAPMVAKGYSLVSADDMSANPRNFKLEGSHDGHNWTAIGSTVYLHKFSGKYSSSGFSFDTHIASYNYFRFTIIFINGGTALKLSEFQLFGYPVGLGGDMTNNGQAKLTGQYGGSTSEQLSNLKNDEVDKIFRQAGAKTCWMQYELDEASKLEAYSLLSTKLASKNNNPKSWKLLASNDAKNWDILDVRSNKRSFDVSNNLQVYKIGNESKRHNWGEYADIAQQSMMYMFWAGYGGSGCYLYQSYHPNPDFINTGFNYWWMAHAIDVFADGLARTKDTKYKNRMKNVYDAMAAYGRGSLWNSFYDDMEWMGLACLRAYEITGDSYWMASSIQLWNWIIGGWNENNGGGIQWVSGQPSSKNACSNTPAIILAARLYSATGEQDYLDWAIKIFNWSLANLIFPETGLVKDAYGNEQHSWTLTYNQGTWIGGCLELYKITGEQKYFDPAMRTIDYVLNENFKFSPYGILYNNEGSGDGGLFKGIFMRYLSQWILSGKLEKERQDRCVSYFIENGKSLFESAFSQSSYLFGNKWYERRSEIKTTDEKSAGYDSSIHLSGVMLFELLAELSRNGFILQDNLHPSSVDNKDKEYKYFRLEITSNNGGTDIELARWQLFSTLSTANNGQALAKMTVEIYTGSQKLFLIKTSDEQIDYEIFDLNSRKIAAGMLHYENIISLNPGIYIVNLSNRNKQMYSQKVIVGAY